MKYKVYNGKELKNFFSESKEYFLLLFFIAGILIGSFSVKQESSELMMIIENYKVMKSAQGFTRGFLNSFGINGIFIAISVFLGFSLIGSPLIYILMIFRGAAAGAFCGYIYSAYRLSGVGYSMVMIYPSLLIAVFALVLSCRDSSEYSVNAYLKSVRGKGQYEKEETRIFLVRQLIYIGITAIAALLETSVNILFSGIFSI